MKLPRPYAAHRRLTFHEALALDALKRFTGDDGLGTRPAGEALTELLRVTPADAAPHLAALERRRILLMTASHFALLSPLSRALKHERDRNRHRAARGTPADWSLRTTVLARFPSLRGPVERPATYTRPAAFEALLAETEHYHRRACPANVEILTDACYPGELTTVLTLLAEQRSANREPVLLYTRKALYLGVRRSPKR